VAQRIASHITISGSVRQLTDAHAIENNPDHALKMWFARGHRAALQTASSYSAGNCEASATAT
jgi:hypothetical protein